MKVLTNILFVLFLLAPSIATFLPLEKKLDENRLPAPAPRFQLKRLLDKRFYQEFGHFFNDRIGGRAYIIALRNWIDYHAFRASPVPKVHFGRNGWFYLRQTLRDHEKNACRERDLVEKLFLDLHGAEKILAAAGRRFLFFPVPNKERIYPENVGLPDPANSCGRNFLDLLLEWNQEYPLASLLDIRRRLLEKKESQVLYDPAGTHWNSMGAEIAAHALLEKAFAPDPPFQFPSLRHKRVLRRGEFQRMLPWIPAVEPTFTIDRLDYTWRVVETKRDPVIRFASMRHRIVHSELVDSESLPDLPDAIAYHDSFLMTYLFSMIQGAYRSMDLLWTPAVPSKEGHEDLRAYDQVILEIVERHLRFVDINLSKLASFFAPELKKYVLQSSSVKVSHDEKRRCYRLDNVPGSNPELFTLLRLTFESPETGIISVSYKDRSYPRPEPLSREITLSPEHETYFIPVPFDFDGSLLLKPAKGSPRFTLSNLEILRLP